MKIYNIDYAEDYLPKKISMRKIEYNSGKIKQNYHFGFNNKLHIFYTYLNNLLKNSIGKSFDSVFSKFCKNIPEYISSVNTRTIFKDCFIEYNTIIYHDSYTIDKNGCIQNYSEKRKKPHNDIEINSDKYHYEINSDIFNYFFCFHLNSPFLVKFFFARLIKGEHFGLLFLAVLLFGFEFHSLTCIQSFFRQ